jgi:hypothetical protein
MSLYLTLFALTLIVHLQRDAPSPLYKFYVCAIYIYLGKSKTI